MDVTLTIFGFAMFYPQNPKIIAIAMLLPVLMPFAITDVVITKASTMSPAAQATPRVKPVPLVAV